MNIEERLGTVVWFAQAMRDIASGDLPMDVRKNAYEFCTRKNLFTGETLTDETLLITSLLNSSDSIPGDKNEIIEILNEIHIEINARNSVNDTK